MKVLKSYEVYSLATQNEIINQGSLGGAFILKDHLKIADDAIMGGKGAGCGGTRPHLCQIGLLCGLRRIIREQDFCHSKAIIQSESSLLLTGQVVGDASHLQG